MLSQTHLDVLFLMFNLTFIKPNAPRQYFLSPCELLRHPSSNDHCRPFLLYWEPPFTAKYWTYFPTR